jgi:hypothetical protein
MGVNWSQETSGVSSDYHGRAFEKLEALVWDTDKAISSGSVLGALGKDQVMNSHDVRVVTGKLRNSQAEQYRKCKFFLDKNVLCLYHFHNAIDDRYTAVLQELYKLYVAD